MDHRGVAGLVGLVWYFVLRFGQATDLEAARAQIAVEDAKEHAERARRPNAWPTPTSRGRGLRRRRATSR